jgi:hypothetical protein
MSDNIIAEKDLMKFSDCPTFDSKFWFLVMKSMGWNITNFHESPYKGESFVWIAYPHTSNWDTFWGYVALSISDVPFFIVVKDLYDKAIFKPVVKLAHLLPIKRDNSAIEVINRKIKENKSAMIVMIPEGTRNKVPGWKSGFHHFAVKNNLRILPTYVCYERKMLVHCEPISPGVSAEETIAKCKEIYDREKPIGKYPDLASPIISELEAKRKERL